MKKFDLVVIGGGSGGVRAARIAASHGAQVALCEQDRMGGTCVIRGCVPKKLFAYAADYAQHFVDAKAFGWTVDKPQFDWSILKRHKDVEIQRLEQIYGGLMDQANVTRFSGKASFRDAHTVEVAGEHIEGKKILIAVGGTPYRPEIPGAELGWVSDDMFELSTLPQRTVVVGGGYIAVEFAGILHGFGVEVDLVYRGDKILRGFDDEIRDHLQAEMQQQGIRLHLNTTFDAVEKHADGLHLICDGSRYLTTDGVLFATGRTPNTAALNLSQAGVRLAANGSIPVDGQSRTNIPHIYAVGDVTDRIALTPVAIREGHAFADSTYSDEPWLADHQNVPSAVFSHPPIAVVGVTEQQALEAGLQVKIFRSSFKPLKHTISGRETRALIKLIVDESSDRILGAHMIGEDAPEIMQGIAIAVHAGLTKAQLDATVGIHPTAAEEFVTLR